MSRHLRTRLAQIENQITALHSQIYSLQADHQAVREELAAIVYPILTLPNEITSEIFLHFARDCRPRQCGPVLLSSVCSLWRGVALSTPRLWTHFEGLPSRTDEDDAYRHPADDAQLFAFLQLWLSRAGQLPLELEISLHSSSHPDHDKILRVLQENCFRWRSLDLHCADPLILSGPLLTLTKISLSFGANEFAVFPVLQNAPSLCEVVLREITFSPPDVPSVSDWRTSLQWGQLTILRFSEQKNISACVQILEHTPNLELLEYAVAEWDGSFTPPPTARSPTRKLARLRTLIIGSDWSHTLVSYLILPALRELRLDTPFRKCGWDVADLIQQSGCTLEMLQFCIRGEGDVSAMKHHLRMAPTVQSLILRCPGSVTNSTFRALFEALKSYDDRLFPALALLELRDCAPNIPLLALAEMLANRSVFGLVSFKLSFSEFAPGEYEGDDESVSYSIEAIRRLRSGGLEVEVQRGRVKWYSDRVNSEMIEKISRPL